MAYLWSPKAVVRPAMPAPAIKMSSSWTLCSIWPGKTETSVEDGLQGEDTTADKTMLCKLQLLVGLHTYIYIYYICSEQGNLCFDWWHDQIRRHERSIDRLLYNYVASKVEVGTKEIFKYSRNFFYWKVEHFLLSFVLQLLLGRSQFPFLYFISCCMHCLVK